MDGKTLVESRVNLTHCQLHDSLETWGRTGPSLETMQNLIKRFEKHLENQKDFCFSLLAAGPSQQMPASQHCSALAP